MAIPSRRVKEEEESGEENDLFITNNQKNVKKTFEDEGGHPICFYIHRSIQQRWVINNLTSDIERYGGMVRPDDTHVDTVLVDETKVDKARLQQAYDASFDRERRTIWVEPVTFIGHCIRQGFVSHRLPTKMPMGGMIPGAPMRVPFTKKDDHDLARYLALKLPEKSAGGRRGEKIYQDMVSLANVPDFQEHAWVKRHTWQSWRNRYNKNTDRFDLLIDRYVKQEEPTTKQHHQFDRRICKTYSPTKRRVDADSGEEDNKHEQYSLSPPPKRVRLSKSQGRSAGRPEAGLGRSSGSGSRLQMAEPSQKPDFKALFGDSEDDEPEAPIKQKVQPFVGRQPAPHNSQYFLSEPQTSQATLVPSPSQPRRRIHFSRKSTSDTQHFRNTFVNRSPDMQFRTAFDRSPPMTPSPVHPMDNTTNLITPQNHSPQSKNQDAIARPRINLTVAADGRRRRAVKKPTHPALSAAPSKAPYPTARSPMRTPGPSVAAVTTQEGTRVSPKLTQLIEEQDEDDVQTLDSQDAGDTSTRVRETQDEEAVEGLLVNEVSESSREVKADDLDGEQPASATPAAASSSEIESESLDSDDQQTDLALHQPPAAAVSQNQASLLLDPEKVLRKFEESLNLRAAVPQRRKQPFWLNVPGPSRNGFEAATTSTPRSGIRSQTRESSTSAESFPTAGTKASAVKKMIEIREKRTPYKPPAGTRAALYGSSP